MYVSRSFFLFSKSFSKIFFLSACISSTLNFIFSFSIISDLLLRSIFTISPKKILFNVTKSNDSCFSLSKKLDILVYNALYTNFCFPIETFFKIGSSNKISHNKSIFSFDVNVFIIQRYILYL